MDDNSNAAENPYAAPPIDADLAMANSLFDPDISQDERIRKEYLSHEAEVRSLGSLYFWGAFINGVMTLVNLWCSIETLAMMNTGRFFYEDLSSQVMAMIIFGFFTALFFFTGLGLRRLQPWSRISSGIISVIGLLLFPIGTLINAYLLYLMLSRKAKVIFSAEYREIIERTPHIKNKTTLMVKIIVGILLAVLLLGILAINLQTP